MLAFLLNRACEVQIASQAGGIQPYVPSQNVIEATVGQARMITDGTSPFNAMTWRSWRRLADRVAPAYKT